MFIELHEKGTNYPILVRVNAIDIVTIEDRGRMNDPTTVLTIGNERYEVVEAYERVFYMVMGYERGVINSGGYSAE